MPAQNLIELNNVTVRRENVTILDRISWTLPAGRHCAMLGVNGSGKTSLLEVVTGYRRASEGEVRTLGRLHGETIMADLRRRIGWVSSAFKRRFPEDESVLDVALSGFEASVGLYREFTDNERERAAAALNRLGASELGGRRFGTLSQGERQRALLARSLVHQPKLLILDEPCVGLDPVAAMRFGAMLGELAAEDGAPAMIYVTHHIEDIPPFIDEALVMLRGEILASGAIEPCLTDEILSQAYGCACRAGRENGRWRIDWLATP